MVEDSFLGQVITQPAGENNILDQVLVSGTDLIRDCKVREKASGYDHHTFSFNVSVRHKLVDNSTLIPNYRKANFNFPSEILPHVRETIINGNLDVSTIEDM